VREFALLLRRNRNYRYTWMGQVVSEIGDNFNNIAVFGLVMQQTHSGLVVSGVFLARALAMLLAGPVSGVLLDRMDRRRIMIASDLLRAMIALAFILVLRNPSLPLLYGLSALLMFASPFFTSGRSSILPVIASKDELHTANSLTQTTQWTSVAIGSYLGGASSYNLGFEIAFIFNALSFVISAFCISRLRVGHGLSFRAGRDDLTESHVARPWHEYKEGLRYIVDTPLLLALSLLGVGWATGGGAAQILFSIFGDQVFGRGSAGIGEIWGTAGVGLILGGAIANTWGRRLSFQAYLWTVTVCYVVHGATYILYSQSRSYPLALFFICLSRAAVAISSVLNFTQLLRHVSDEYRGRVFSTNETLVWATMMISMVVAGGLSTTVNPRTIGTVAGILGSATALVWGWAVATRRIPEPLPVGVEPEEVEMHGDPNA
jgi:MFS family permease